MCTSKRSYIKLTFTGDPDIVKTFFQTCVPSYVRLEREAEVLTKVPMVANSELIQLYMMESKPHVLIMVTT